MLKEKIKTVLQDGLEPYLEGKRNHESPTPEMEALAAKRLEVCKGCRYYKDEPIPWLRVEDGKSCGKCGCILAYKVRQNLKKCKRWGEL